MPHAQESGVEVEDVQACVEALSDILEHARTFREIHGLERALTRAEFPDKFGAFENASPTAVEAAARDVFYHILTTTNFDSPGFVDVWNLLDICQIFSDDGTSESSLAFYLVEELLESLLLQQCRAVFDYLELRREVMTANNMQSKHLIMLRACNELLRRLSRAEDTAFSGRVFIYLFQIIEYGDQSAVNLRGTFHIENVTTYDEQAGYSTEAMEIEVPLATQDVSETATSSTPADGTNLADEQAASLSKLYPTFWSIQKYFSQPTLLFDESHLEMFKHALEATLSKFKQVQRESTSTSQTMSDEPGPDLKRKRENEDDLADAFNPKYLTSPDLFELEISDLAFRRHILVQGLILMDFLLYQTPTSKRKLPTLNKNILYNFTLSEDQTQWANNMRSELASYLQQGTEGKFYYRMVDTVLSRDKNWVYWKAERCKKIRKDPITADDYTTSRKNSGNASISRNIRSVPMGSLDLAFLQTRPAEDRFRNLCDDQRYTLPQTEVYRMGIMDDEMDIERAKTDDEKAVASESKTSKTWRTLRLAARTQFRAFDKIDDGKDLEPLFRMKEAEVDEQEEQEDPKDGSKDGIATEGKNGSPEPSQADAMDGGKDDVVTSAGDARAGEEHPAAGSTREGEDEPMAEPEIASQAQAT